MKRPFFRKFRRGAAIVLSALLVMMFIAVNAMAFMQARAMTHFIAGNERTLPPEHLTTLSKLKVLFTGVRIPRPLNDASPTDVGLVFETVRFGGSTGNECEAWYVQCDAPKGICIQFHAYAASKSSLLPTARAFHDMGYDVLMIDFHGSGGSAGNDTTIGYTEAVDVVDAVALANKRWPSERQILYGQSMGGAAILRAVAQLNVNPSAVIIESTFDRLLSTVENRFDAMKFPSFPLARMLVFWGGIQEGYSGFKHNPDDYAQHVHCPVLMMQGSLDARVTDAQAQNLFDHLAGPKQFELFGNCGHCGFMSGDNTRWTKVTSAFLAGLQE
jgi:alpha-beta hydrolase superfamily lysophospholipase